MGLFGKVYRWRQAKIADGRRHTEQQALARRSSPEEARKAEGAALVSSQVPGCGADSALFVHGAAREK